MSRLLWYPGHELLVADIVRAENCHLYDSAGKRYVDLESGVWCTSVGHCHPRVLRVISEQSALIVHTGFCYANAVAQDAAREILSLLDLGDGRCAFLCSGAEAVEYGVRIAQTVLERPLLLTMADSYFGAYGAAATRRPGEWFSFDWTECAACPYPGDCGASCRHWAAIPFDDIGGFLFEPGSSAGLVRFPPVKLVQSIVARIKSSGGLVLVNEVTTGVGRTGTWFGFQHYGIAPDIVALGKGLGAGFPVSVAACSARVAERLGDGSIRFAQSHQNDPLGAAVAREVVRIIKDERLIERGREIAELLSRGLRDIEARRGRVKEVRSRGVMAAVELADDAGAPFTIRTHRELVRRGFIVGRRPGVSVLRLDPSLTIERTDIEQFLCAFGDVLARGAP